MSLKNKIPSVNYHLWEPCNMRCKFCFATFQDVKQSVLPRGHLPEAEAIQVVELLADAGFEKITFAGGEPLLCPWLGTLIETAKNRDMTTMIVTNGSKLSKEWLSKHQSILDWVTLSIDSLNAASNLETGRAITGKKALSPAFYASVIKNVHELGMRLKINTVVSSVNYLENMASFIATVKPERWKLFQVLPIQGQNDTCINDFLITKEQFLTFAEEHKAANLGIPIIAETNELMTASYAMVDPAGRFFDNSKGRHTYSEKMLEVGVEKAFQQVLILEDRFLKRDGVYNWKK
jgi:radical S-adenosyl methionine domain-containing protein 2